MGEPDLSVEDEALIRRCLQLAADGPYFPDWEFQTLFGRTRGQVRTIASTWPNVDNLALANLAVNNAMNNLTGYPHGLDTRLESETGATLEHIRTVFGKWRKAAAF